MSDQGVEQSIQRIEALITALDSLADPAAREPARALLEVVLDLHAVALARLSAMIASSPGGVALLQHLSQDDAVRAVLLLHGLHPETVETRVERAIDALRPRLAARGIGLKLVQCNATSARVRVRWIGAVSEPDDAAAIRQEIEAIIIEAAPDLAALAIEGLDETLAALAG